MSNTPPPDDLPKYAERMKALGVSSFSGHDETGRPFSISLSTPTAQTVTERIAALEGDVAAVVAERDAIADRARATESALREVVAQRDALREERTRYAATIDIVQAERAEAERDRRHARAAYEAERVEVIERGEAVNKVIAERDAAMVAMADFRRQLANEVDAHHLATCEAERALARAVAAEDELKVARRLLKEADVANGSLSTALAAQMARGDGGCRACQSDRDAARARARDLAVLSDGHRAARDAAYAARDKADESLALCQRALRAEIDGRDAAIAAEVERARPIVKVEVGGTVYTLRPSGGITIS